MAAAAVAALLLASAVPLVGAAIEEDGRYSTLWGKDGELWKPDGRLPDFSFAGELVIIHESAFVVLLGGDSWRIGAARQ